jgi:hypothetical protein
MPSRAGTAQTDGGVAPGCWAIVRLIIETKGKESGQHGRARMSHYGAWWRSGPWVCHLAHKSSPSPEGYLQDVLQ